MPNRHILFLLLITNLPILLLANTPASSNATSPSGQLQKQQDLAAKTIETINLDGDISLSPEQNRIFWNPHCVGLASVSDWKITFTDTA
jgi:hypothetical protein